MRIGSETASSIAGLQDADSQRSTIIDAFARLRWGDAFDEVAAFVQSLRQSAPQAVALGVLGPGGAGNVSLVGRLRRDYPGHGIVLVCDATSIAVQQLPHLVRAGADEVVLTSMATATELVGAMDRACARRREESVWQRIAPSVPAECHDIVEICFTSAVRRRSVGELALHLGVDRSTIARRLRRAGLPRAHTILSWSRLIAVAGFMESTRISVEQAAHAAGFGSAASLRAFTQRMVGWAPGLVAERGKQRLVTRFACMLARRPPSRITARGGRLTKGRRPAYHPNALAFPSSTCNATRSTTSLLR